MKILITGGAGFIASHVTEQLVARGDEVLGIDNFATGQRRNLCHAPTARLVEGTIADQALINRLFDEYRPDAVVHAAAGYKDPEDWAGDAETNTVGGANIVKACRDFGVKRLVYFQTSLCYGVRPLEQPITLAHPIMPANSSYAITKTAAEQFMAYSGIDYVSFRLANVVGPRNISGPLPVFFQRLTEGKRCFVTPARRDFVYVGDLVRYVLRALDGAGNGAYHFSSGTDVAVRDLYDLVVSALGVDPRPEPELRPLGPDDASSILLDPSRTFADFGAIDFTPLPAVVDETIAFYREYGIKETFTHLRHAD